MQSMNNKQDQFVEKLLALKTESGWSWERMAEEFNRFHGGIQGVTGPTLFRYAKGTSRPRNEMLRQYVTDALDALEETENALMVSESKRIEAEEELEMFFNLSLDLFTIASETHFLKLNPAWQETLGWSLEELMAKPWMEFVHPDDIGNTEQAVQHMGGGNLTLAFENRYRHKDGGYVRLAWKATQWTGGKTFTVSRVISDET
jgi:PAS domain S-box-containing protein